LRKNPLRLICTFLKALLQNRQIIVMVSDNGRKVLFPMLYYASKMGKEVYHYAIGGRLANDVREKPNWKKYVSGFESNWMESHELVDNLHRLGVKNACYLPNFKKLDIVYEDMLIREYKAPFHLCTFSRVMEEKGIEDAINAVREINNEYGKELVALDIYGPCDSAYRERLDSLLKEVPYCRYCGSIPSNESVTVLRDYYALLFPTHFLFEGIPGTIIDALSAGIPVIARRWQYCDEMLEHGKNGYIYSFDEPDKLKDMILYAVSHTDEICGMKKHCINKAREYCEDYVMQFVAEKLRIAKGDSTARKG